MEIFGIVIKKRVLIFLGILIFAGLVYVVFVDEKEVQRNFKNAIIPKAEFSIQGFKLFESLKGGKDWNLKASVADIYRNKQKSHLKEVKLTFYGKNGRIFKLFSDEAELDMTTKIVQLEKNVRAESNDGYNLETNSATFFPDDQILNGKEDFMLDGPDLILTGKGFKVNIKKRHFSIFSNVKTQVKNQQQGELLKLKKAKDARQDLNLIIRSNKCEFDMTTEQAIYVGNVVGTGNEIQLNADKMDILYFMKNNQRSIKKVDARGNVIITRGQRKSKSKRALLLSQKSEIVLTGDPTITENGSVVQGERIVYNYQKDRFKISSAKGTYQVE